MQLGVSTACFYPEYTEKALEVILKNNVKFVEIFVNCLEEITPKYLEKIKNMTDYYGAKVLSIHPFTSGMEPLYFFGDYPRRFEEGLDLYKKYFEAALILSAKIVVFHGASKNRNKDILRYFERFNRIWETANNVGISLCQENISRCLSFSPDFFRMMAKELPHVSYLLDTKQAKRAGQDIFEMAEVMSGRIAHLHISDNCDTQDCMVPGTGTFNIEKLLTNISLSGFNGGVIVELYRENFNDIVELIGGFKHISTILSTALNNR